MSIIREWINYATTYASEGTRHTPQHNTDWNVVGRPEGMQINKLDEYHVWGGHVPRNAIQKLVIRLYMRRILWERARKCSPCLTGSAPGRKMHREQRE